MNYIPALHHYGHQGLAEFHARQVERMKEAEIKREQERRGIARILVAAPSGLTCAF